ncbi:MAG: glycosyltransferase [Myxococcales bacterium]|nr:glycosyltransferase [Myxococcales bacterium]
MLDRVRFVGELPELAVLLAEASVVALPADDLYGKVDVPLAVLEALALGVPLVLARGGPLETVTTASFVDAADTQGLADALAHLLESDAARAEQAAAGKALYARVFRPEVVAARYEEIYEGWGGGVLARVRRHSRVPRATGPGFLFRPDDATSIASPPI